MDFIEKFKSVLPSDVDFDELYELAPADLWEKSPRKAAIAALKRLDVFDENEYKLEYEDVKDSDIDPVEHYIKYGIDEDRYFFLKIN